MSSRKRPVCSTDLFLANPAARNRSRDLLSAAYTSPFTEHSAYRAHHSCVNALAISPGDGRWLASGGDDRRVMLHEALASDDAGSLGEPKACYEGPQSNTFAVSFACDGQKLFSTGNDAAIICYDLETSAATVKSPGRPAQVWIDNDDSVHGLACHPANPHLFLSASSDGTLRQYDTRSDTNAVGILADAHEMEGVAYHPAQHDLFAYSGEDAHAGLVDARMAWATDTAPYRGRIPSPRMAREVAVVNWQANLVRGPPPADSASTNKTPRTRRARPAASSVTFSPTGSLVALTLSGHVPTLYTLSSPSPLATLSAPDPPVVVGQRKVPRGFPTSYRNVCTTKHGSFGGGPGAREGQGLFYAAGSDDFAIYVWEVPSKDKMERGSQRTGFDQGQWPSGAEGTAYLSPSTTTSPAGLTFPHSISQPSSVVRAHRSIPNTTLYHPSLPYLYSCGVEKTVIRHGPSPTFRRARRDDESSDLARPPGPGGGGDSDSSWQFVERVPRAEPTSFLSSLFGPGVARGTDNDDDGDDDRSLPGETEEERDRRLRREDVKVLEYFDELIVSELDREGFWRDARDGEVDGRGDGYDSDSDDHLESSLESLEGVRDDEDDEDEEDGEEERIAGGGDRGTTRRILNSIYALEELEPSENDDEVDEDESQESLTLSEEEEYHELMRAWETRDIGDGECTE